MKGLAELTVIEASELIGSREVSCGELVEALLERIEETEPVVRAYALILEETARKVARERDEELSRGICRGPLHGIPVGVKDICYTRGIPTEGGSRALRGYVPTYDATVVGRLDAAGAVLLGKTATHEFAWGVNDPPTMHPWQADCYPGGSSTGSGVAVATRSAMAAIGTDTGGSIRIPASVNGIVGLKPTFGRVSSHGVMKVAHSLDHVGPLTRTVSDCAVVLQAIAGFDANDATTIHEPVPDYLASIEAGVAGMRIGVEREHYFYSGVTNDVRVAVNDVIAHLASQGAEIVEVEVPEFAVMATVLLTILFPEASSYHRELLRERGRDYDAATRQMASLGDLVPGSHYVTALRARVVLQRAVRAVFESNGLHAMIWPTIPGTTVPKDRLNRAEEDGATPMNRFIHHTFTANVLGLPAMSTPCGRSRDGLPIGFDLIGRPFEEATIFRIARTYERAHRWHEDRPVRVP